MLVQLASIIIAASLYLWTGNLLSLLVYPAISFSLHILLLRRRGYWSDKFEAFTAAKIRKFVPNSESVSLKGISVIDAKLACQSFFTPVFERHITVFIGQLMQPGYSKRSGLVFMRHEVAHCKAHELFNTTVEQLSPVFGWIRLFSQHLFKISALSKYFNAIILTINEVGFHTFEVAQTMAIARRISLKELRTLYLYHLLEELEHSYECIHAVRQINPLLRLAWSPLCLLVLIFVNLAFELFGLLLLLQHNWKEAVRYVLSLEIVIHLVVFVDNVTRALVIIFFEKFPSENVLEQRHCEYTAAAREEFGLELSHDSVHSVAR